MFVASFKTQIICYPAFLHYYYKVPWTAAFTCGKTIFKEECPLSCLFRFVWRKKIERDVSQGQKVDISVKSEKKRQLERMVLGTINFSTSSIYLFRLLMSKNLKHIILIVPSFTWRCTFIELTGFITQCIFILFLVKFFISFVLYGHCFLASKYVVQFSSKRKVKIMFFLQRLILILTLSNIGWNRKG